MEMNTENITLGVVLVRDNQSEERLGLIPRLSFGSLLSKASLLNFILDELFSELNDLTRYVESFKIERKSKKHKKFVSLENPDDFKELMRSLKVKNHVKLVVYEVDKDHRQPESAVTDALEQVKKLVGELQKSDLWDVLRSFASAYSMQLSPDGGISMESTSNSINTQSHEEVVHEFVTCDSCHPDDTFGNIHGKRFKCIVCENFDLCEKCYSSKATILGHLIDHPMIAIPDSRLYRGYSHALFGSCPSKCLYGTVINTSDSKQELRIQKLFMEKLGQDVPDVICQIEKCIDHSKKYSELEGLAPDSSPDKFSVLKELIINSKGAEISRRSTVEVNSSSSRKVWDSSTKCANDFGPARKSAHTPCNIELTVNPKGTSLSQIIISNKSDIEFDCENLKFEIMNCFGKIVASVSAHKKHALLRGRCAKFNILVNNTHFKYPFKVSISNGVICGSCELSLKSLSADVTFSSHEEEVSSSMSMEDCLELNGGNLNTTEKPRVLRAIEEHGFDIEAKSVAKQDEQDSCSDATDDDYDMISLADADEIASDFEVLSNINSYES